MPGATTSNQTATKTGTTTTAPWDQTIPALQGILGGVNNYLPNYTPTPTENAAFNGLYANANAGNPYAAGIANTTNTLQNGGIGIQDYINGMTPYATMNTNPYENPAFQNLLATQANDITKQIKSDYAGAGYSPTSSGDYAYNLARGISAGTAPTAANAEEYLTNLKTGALGNILNANQQSLSNQLQGAQLAPTALAAADSPYMQLLNISNMQRGLPLGNLGSLENLVVPMAQLGGTQNTQQTATGTSTPSLLSSLGGLLGAGAGTAASPSLAMNLAGWGSFGLNGLRGLFNAGA